MYSDITLINDITKWCYLTQYMIEFNVQQGSEDFSTNQLSN